MTIIINRSPHIFSNCICSIKLRRTIFKFTFIHQTIEDSILMRRSNNLAIAIKIQSDNLTVQLFLPFGQMYLYVNKSIIEMIKIINRLSIFIDCISFLDFAWLNARCRGVKWRKILQHRIQFTSLSFCSERINLPCLPGT